MSLLLVLRGQKYATQPLWPAPTFISHNSDAMETRLTAALTTCFCHGGGAHPWGHAHRDVWTYLQPSGTCLKCCFLARSRAHGQHSASLANAAHHPATPTIALCYRCWAFDGFPANRYVAWLALCSQNQCLLARMYPPSNIGEPPVRPRSKKVYQRFGC